MTNIIPDFERIKISNTFPGSKYTQQNIQPLCNKEESKFLYIKKGKFNKDLHYVN